MDLTAVGLSGAEQRAYEALIRLGKSTASEISREGNVTYGRIYEVLAKLERKGLVKVIPDTTKKFVPGSPASMLKLIRQQERHLAKAKEQVEEYKQVYEQHEEEVVQTMKGKRNFYRILRKMREPEKVSYSIKYAAEFQAEWLRKDNERRARGVKVKSLVRYDKETQKNVDKWVRHKSDMRVLDNRGVAVALRDCQVLITLIKNNTHILISDQAFVDLITALFENYYNTHPKITPESG